MPEYEEVDRELHERPREYPQETECRVLITGLEITSDQEVEHLTPREDLPNGRDNRARTPSAPHTDGVHRKRRQPREACFRSIGVRFWHGPPILCTWADEAVYVPSAQRRRSHRRGCRIRPRMPRTLAVRWRSRLAAASDCGRCSRKYIDAKSLNEPLSMKPARFRNWI